MEVIQLGNSGPMISRLSMGGAATGGHGWGRVEDDDSRRAIERALDQGVTFFDTADVYGLGHAERILSQSLGPHRKRVVIATKFGVRWDSSGRTWKDVRPIYLRHAVEASLRRLQLECIPLYYVHWPDGVTPIEETLREMERCRQAGKIGWIGLSNHTAAEALQASQVVEVASIQARFNLLDREQAPMLLDVAQRITATFTTWGSLAEGLLTGKYSLTSTFGHDDRRSRYENFLGETYAANVEVVKRLRSIAARLGKTPAQIALRWLLDTPGVGVVLFGAKTPEQVDDNLGALGWHLSHDDYAELNSLTQKRAA